MTDLASLRAELRRHLATLIRRGDASAAPLATNAEATLGAGINDDTDLLAAGVIGSLSLMTMVNHLEEAYRLTVSQRDLFAGRLRSVTAIAALIAERAGRSAS
jgi:acyl carrier protein